MSGTAEKTVLVVEDDDDVRDVIMEVLGDNGFSPRGAQNGREALKLLRGSRQAPCVILLDIMMPVMDGPQFRAEQRQDPDLKDVPVVVLSAHANVEDAAREMAAAAYMKKPVELELLLAVIGRLCC